MADKEIKLEYSKTKDGRNLLVLSSVYKHNCSDQETVIVDDDVLEVFSADAPRSGTRTELAAQTRKQVYFPRQR